MIEKRTVFVLGAGASCPYGFPTARGLRKEILGKFKGQYGLMVESPVADRNYQRRQQGYPRMKDAVDFLNTFDLSSTESIDLFLSRNPRFQMIGKIAICLSILNGERRSCFREEVRQIDEDWYFHLYNRLTREFTGRDGYQGFGKIPISFVTFNHDRSLEYFLFNSLLHSFEGADQQKIEAQIAQIPIIHVYGRIAGLEWGSDQSRLEYGKHFKDTTSVDSMKFIDNLYVAHEERMNPQLEVARKQIQEAERVFFLGFGYAKENLDALGLPVVLKPGQYIYGTAMAFTKEEIRRTTLDLARGLTHSEELKIDRSQQVKIVDCDCRQLLREFL